MPFTYQRRHTYPIPPYSTVIGLLCNVLGIYDQNSDLYGKLLNLKISIAGRFETKITEYIWFRNLSKSRHIERFGSVENRETNGHIEHIGGQSPMWIDVLNEVHLVIYLEHENEKFIEDIKESLSNPTKRLEILHLGRAEDLIVLEEEPKIIEEKHLQYGRRDADYGHFFWIPNNLKNDNFEGLLYNLPTFVTIENYEQTFNRHGKRNFRYIRTKLNDGLIKGQEFLLDREAGIPIFLGDFNGK